MYDEFIGDRIAALRTAKGVSARDMSLSIGQSANYINKIESKKSFPSMAVFLYICDYFEITPKEFFDESIEHPVQLVALFDEMKRLDADALGTVSSVVREILRKK